MSKKWVTVTVVIFIAAVVVIMRHRADSQSVEPDVDLAPDIIEV